MSRGYKRRKKLMSNPLWESPSEKSARCIQEFNDNVVKYLLEMKKKYDEDPVFRAEIDKMNSEKHKEIETNLIEPT